jgi:hypothetical protein
MTIEVAITALCPNSCVVLGVIGAPTSSTVSYSSFALPPRPQSTSFATARLKRPRLFSRLRRAPAGGVVIDVVDGAEVVSASSRSSSRTARSCGRAITLSGGYTFRMGRLVDSGVSVDPDSPRAASKRDVVENCCSALLVGFTSQPPTGGCRLLRSQQQESITTMTSSPIAEYTFGIRLCTTLPSLNRSSPAGPGAWVRACKQPAAAGPEEPRARRWSACLPLRMRPRSQYGNVASRGTGAALAFRPCVSTLGLIYVMGLI